MAIKKVVMADPADGGLNNNPNIGLQLLELLRQLFFKIPRMAIDANDQVRVSVGGGSLGDVRNYPRFTPETSSELIVFKGAQYTNVRWQQQRSFLID